MTQGTCLLCDIADRVCECIRACMQERGEERGERLLVGVVDVDPGWFFDTTTPSLYIYMGTPTPTPENATNVYYIHLGTPFTYIIISEG